MAFLPIRQAKASFMPGDTNRPYCYDSGNERQAALQVLIFMPERFGLAIL
ncbi:hypothetical protein Arad_1750 [Rhizobium rhizogenes K84]|uniref:Uncharacterized protein n=1 Tax=Rhizobium rhizogenes (strain K84 / ATCC BAA-868) TaxID=311403 RepID=B9JCX2_RHIR8|nr:hypothetical protein Arad_1750 [Rhizobium rhizogenes K84]